MKIQKMHKVSLLVLTMLFGLPASLMAADEKWDRMLDALHHNKAAVSDLSKQDQAVLEAAILLKAHRPEQAMSILEDQSDDPLIKQLKVQAAREHLVEVVRRAGGERSEVNLPAPSEKLNKALAEVDSRLNVLMTRLHVEDTNDAGGQSVQTVNHNISLTGMVPADRWKYILNTLQNNTSKAAQQLSKRDRAILQIAVLLKTRKPAQALKVLETQHADAQIKHLKIHVSRERIVEAVRKAGGNRSEVHLPDAPAGMVATIAEVNANLQTFVQQLAGEKTMPLASPVQVASNDVAVVMEAKKPLKKKTPPAAAVVKTPPAISIVQEKPLVRKEAPVDAEAKVLPDVKADAPVSEPVAVRVAQKAEEINSADKASGQALSPEAHEAVLLAVETWRSSWSDRDVDGYFSTYANDFDTTDRFASVEAWKTYKRWVIGKRSSIQVTLERIKVSSLPDDQVRVEFLQHFRADSYQSDDLKALTFRQSDSGWKIIREESI